MDVIGHQAISPYLSARASRSLSQEVAVEYVVGIPEEHLLPAIAALRHVIWIAGQHEARETRHGAAIAHAGHARRRTGSNLVLLVNWNRNSNRNSQHLKWWLFNLLFPIFYEHILKIEEIYRIPQPHHLLRKIKYLCAGHPFD